MTLPAERATRADGKMPGDFTCLAAVVKAERAGGAGVLGPRRRL